MRLPRLAVCALLFFCGLALASSTANSQTMWLDRDVRRAVRIERWGAESPTLANRGASYALFATARVPIAAHAWLVTELPYAHANLGTTSYADEPLYLHDATVGSVYFGAELVRNVTGVRYEAGVRLPIARSDALGARYKGQETSVERQQAFLERALAFRVGAALHRAATPRLRVGYDLGLAATWQIPQETSPFEQFHEFDSEPFDLFGSPRSLGTWDALFVDGVANLRMEGPHVRFGVGLDVRWLASNGQGDIGSNSVNDLSFALELLRGPIHPGVVVTFPLDSDQKSLTANSVGLTLSTGRTGWDKVSE